MSTIRDVLTYYFDKRLSQRKIESSCGISRTQIRNILKTFKERKLMWPLPGEWNDEELERRLGLGEINRKSTGPEIDHEYIYEERKKKGATLTVLHEEWKCADPNGNTLSYSAFLRRHNSWRRKKNLSMRVEAKYGEAAYIDYSGMTFSVTDSDTGEKIPHQIFVAVLGGSNYTYAEATATQTIPDFLASHINMFEFFGGVPEIIVCDNLKSAVMKAHIFDPKINSSYRHLCRHYGIVPVPARPYKPKDKSRGEGAVLLVQRYILFRLRRRIFFTKEELNLAIREALEGLNRASFKKREGSRYSKWQEEELPKLRPLPAQRYEVTEWGHVRAGADYCVRVANQIYSVPYLLRNEEFDYRLTATAVELIYKGKSIVTHQRSYKADHPTILKEHRPPAHTAFAHWNREEGLQWASMIGPATAEQLGKVLDLANDSTSGYRRTQAFKAFEKSFTAEALELACGYALKYGITDLKSFREILDRKSYNREDESERDRNMQSIDHENIRGSAHYRQILSNNGGAQK